MDSRLPLWRLEKEGEAQRGVNLAPNMGHLADARTLLGSLVYSASGGWILTLLRTCD